jgi:signal transduction histidine kinase
MGRVLSEGRLSETNPVAAALRRDRRPLAQYEIDLLPRFTGMAPEERDWLAGLDMDVYVPIYAKGAWIGILALGQKNSGDRYFDDDLVLLKTVADQTAVALENARLYEDLKERNSENESLNQELITANEELARLDQAKSDFINIASHELRTPLTQVIGYNDILSEMVQTNTLQPEVGGQMIDSVRRAARRLEEIVNTMFDVSKLDTKTLDLAQSPVSPAVVIENAVEAWTKAMEERRLTISVRGLTHLPVVMADGKRLTQVFGQLIQNAIKATPDGGQIRVIGRSLEDEASGQEFIEVTVADTGVGIAIDDLERIFDKFYRVGSVMLHSTGSTKFKGAGPGLGLTIARGIIEAHGGKIWAESPGHDEESCPGSKFNVVLPVRQTVEEH